jgi:hypothetical protein
MMSIVELRLTRDPPIWLPPQPPPATEVALIGWVEDVHRIDEGVPRDVRRIITRALTQEYRLTFLDPGVERTSQWRHRESCATRFVKVSRLVPWIGFGLTSTHEADVAVRLFATVQSLWHLQSQMVFLTQRCDLPPEISFGTLHRLTRSRRLDIRQLQAEFGCAGIMTPGPDGDFVQLNFWFPGALSSFTEGLCTQTQQAQIGLVEVSELEFKRTRWRQ